VDAEKEDDMGEKRLIPLFPLGVVLLPGLPLPLHIFEERYKQMVGECLSRKEVFGIVAYNGTEIKSAGCTAQITDVLKRYEDGRLDIMTVGAKRFVTVETDESKAYLQGWVEFFDDEQEQLEDRDRETALKGLILHNELNRLLGAEAGYDDSGAVELEQISFVLAGSQAFTLDEKQVFLEMTSTRRRINKVVPALEKLIDRYRLTLDIKRIIGGNGHPPSVLGDRE
jgi:Lon protease-like protein